MQKKYKKISMNEKVIIAVFSKKNIFFKKISIDKF